MLLVSYIYDVHKYFAVVIPAMWHNDDGGTYGEETPQRRQRRRPRRRQSWANCTILVLIACAAADAADAAAASHYDISTAAERTREMGV